MIIDPGNTGPSEASDSNDAASGVPPFGLHSHLTGDLFSPQAYSTVGRDVKGSGIDKIFSLLDRLDRDIVPLVAGSPDPHLLPLETLGKLSAEMYESGDPSFLNYGVVDGEYALRTFLAAKFRDEGVPVDEDNVTITTGGVQGIDLMCRFLLDPGDPVVVEAPSYSNTLACILNHRGEIVPVEMEYDGINIEDVERQVKLFAGRGRPVKMIIVNPTFQNPTGITLPLERRKQLLDLAHRHNFVILEDDPYRDLRFSGAPEPLLLALDDGSHVVHTSTFAKTISPGIRVGYVIAAKGVIDRIIMARSTIDNGTNVPAQRLVYAFCRGGYLGPQVERLARAYRTKKEAMVSQLEASFGHDDRVKWTNPEGGFFIWLTLEPEVVTEDLLGYAMAEGVAFVPGSAFDLTKTTTNSLRLSYSFPNEEEIGKGISLLANALRQYRKDKGI